MTVTGRTINKKYTDRYVEKPEYRVALTQTQFDSLRDALRLIIFLLLCIAVNTCGK